MLYFVGLGIEQSPSLKALKILKGCDHVFYESYTSPSIHPGVLHELREQLGDSKVQNVNRIFVEDGKKILEVSKGSNSALVCSGDPLIATTHQELRTRAIKEGIETKIIHGSSIVSSVIGEFGLHSYCFGKSVTMTREPMQHTAYYAIFRNLLSGLHTIILLEWDESQHFFLAPKAAAESLVLAENDIKYLAIGSETLLLVASRLGTDNPSLKVTSVGKVDSEDLGDPPHVLIIPGRLHFTEKEALAAISGKDTESMADNSANIERVSRRMVETYTRKTLTALERAKKVSANSKQKVRFDEIFENVECYTDDAKRFLNEGREELAVLSIGYAEGLLDSLRFGRLLEFEW
jgi:diphthine synthase